MGTKGTIGNGVIGNGSISAAHLNAYKHHPEAKIHAVCDLNEERANKAAQEYGAEKVYTDYRELLADPGVEAVSICTWNNSHAEISVKALEASKHVLVEKPLCISMDEALRMQEAVERSGKILQVGFVRRYDDNAQWLRSLIEKGEFGELYYAKASNLRRLGNPGGWFSDRTRSGGGPLIDIGVHVIDLCWYLMGRPKPVSVSANTYRKLGNRASVQHLSFYKAADYDATANTVEDLANALIRFENGASLLLDVSFTLHAKQNEQSVRLYGEKGGLEIDPDAVIISEKADTIVNIHPQTDHAGFEFKSAFQNEINHFLNCVLHGASPISPVQDGVEIMRILLAIYESAAKGAEVRL